LEATTRTLRDIEWSFARQALGGTSRGERAVLVGLAAKLNVGVARFAFLNRVSSRNIRRKAAAFKVAQLSF